MRPLTAFFALPAVIISLFDSPCAAASPESDFDEGLVMHRAGNFSAAVVWYSKAIESDNRLDLPRPRDVASPEFNAVRRVLGAKLHSHHSKKAA